MGCCNSRNLPSSDNNINRNQANNLRKPSINRNQDNNQTQQDMSKDELLGILKDIPLGSREAIKLILSNEAVNTYPTIAQYFDEKSVSHLLFSLILSREDTLKNGLSLLYELVKSKYQSAFNVLVKLNGLQELTKWMLCSDKDIQFKSAHICHLLYKDSNPAQDAFTAAGGHKILVQILSSSSRSELEVDLCLQFIEDLIIDSANNTRKDICALFYKARIWDVLNQVKLESANISMRVTLIKVQIVQQCISKRH